MKFPPLKSIAFYVGVGVLGAAAALVAIQARAAGIPDTDVLTYTGYLENPDGTPIAGQPAVAVAFYSDAEMTEKALCSAKMPAAPGVVNGRFQVPLPQDCVDAVQSNPHLWVDVEVDGSSLGATKLGAVPYALEAGHSVVADSAAKLDGSKSGFRAVNSKNQSVTINADDKVSYDVEQFDLGGEFDPVTSQFVPAKAGYYQVQCQLTYEQNVFNKVAYWGVVIEVDGVPAVSYGQRGDGQTVSRAVSSTLKLKAGQKVTCNTNHDAADDVIRHDTGTFFEAARLSISE